MSFCEINVSPFATNVLDLIGKDLVTPTRDRVSVRMPGTCFHILINGELRFATDDNIEASRFLNNLQVGKDGAA